MNIIKILEEKIELIKPDKESLNRINKTSDNFVKNLKRKLKSRNICADVFIGGSLAKGTLVKKNKYDSENKFSESQNSSKEFYDVDIFVRFDRNYKDVQISDMLGKLLKGKAKRIHGSRDYYNMTIDGIIFEVIPVIKIKKVNEARNITDLSYFHVSYINKIINKNKKLADEILLAKIFAHAQNCYGAESYIHGFSGYSLELLICHYKSFLNFLKQIARSNSNERIIIDDKKFYKDKNEILRELNESKIQGPIILIDPTFKDRNALAGLSKETFERFKKSCKTFLNNPSSSFFEKKDNIGELKEKNKDLRIVSVKTNKQSGDIAGSKSKKFFEFFASKLERELTIKLKGFDYNEIKNIAYFCFVIEKKRDEIIRGPPITSAENLKNFKKVHPKAFIKKNFAYAKIRHDLSFEEFVNSFKNKNKNIIKEMSVKKIELIK